MTFLLYENHFGLREGCGGTIRVFVRVDEQWGLSFEMTVVALDDALDADVPDGHDSSALRELAAAENAALEATHWDSLQQEIAIADDAFSGNNLFAGVSSESGGFASHAECPHVLPVTDSEHDVSVIDGYSAENTFSHARSRLEPQ